MSQRKIEKKKAKERRHRTVVSAATKISEPNKVAQPIKPVVGNQEQAQTHGVQAIPIPAKPAVVKPARVRTKGKGKAAVDYSSHFDLAESPHIQKMSASWQQLYAVLSTKVKR